MKSLKTILITIISVLFLAFCLEGITYLVQSHRLVKEGYRFIDDSTKAPYPKNIEIFSNHYEKMNKREFFKNKKGLEYKTPSILIFGDVYANALELSNENNLTAKLSILTKRPVYNFASAGWGIPHMYYILKNEEYMSTVKNPDTIIFVYNTDMNNRLTSFSFYPHHTFLNLKYKIKSGILVEDVPQALFAYNSYFIRAIERANGFRISKSKNSQTKQKTYELIKVLFEESRRIAKVRYPSLKKFIIVRYLNPHEALAALKKQESSANAQLEYNMWKKLKDDGFTIIDISELSEENYNENKYLNDDHSPKEETLDEILPLLLNKANL